MALVAGWMAIDVDSYERAVELAWELSAAATDGLRTSSCLLRRHPAWS